MNSTWIGILLEVFVADVLVVLGLAGQKIAVMQADLAQHPETSASVPVPDSGSSQGSLETPLLGDDCSELRDSFPNGASTPPTARTSAGPDGNCFPAALPSTCAVSGPYRDERPPSRSRRMRRRMRQRIGAVRSRFGSMVRRVMLNWRWILAVALFLLGQGCEMVALGFASQTDVVAMGNFGLPWNALVSVLVFKEEFALLPKHSGWRILYQWDLFAMAILVLGATMVVVFAPDPPPDDIFSAEELTRMWTELPYAGFGIGALVGVCGSALAAWYNWDKEHQVGNWNAVLLACICALIASFTVTMSKVTTILIRKTASGDNQYDSLGPVLLTVAYVAMLATSMYLLNVSLGRYEQGLFFPIYEVLSSTLTITSGILYYKTYNDFKSHDCAGFIAGLVVMVLGIFLTSQREHKSTAELEQNLLHRIDMLERIIAAEDTDESSGEGQSQAAEHSTAIPSVVPASRRGRGSNGSMNGPDRLAVSSSSSSVVVVPGPTVNTGGGRATE